MALGFSAATANAFLDTHFATLFAKLHVGDPGAAGATNPSAGDATRKAMTMAAASGGTKAMTGTAGPWTHGSGAGAGTESITHLSTHDAVSAGNFKASMALGTPQSWSGTNTFTLLTWSVTVAPLAS